MRMQYVRVIGRPITLSEGSRVALGVEQARRRLPALAEEKGATGVFRLLSSQTFKAGEVLGVPTDAGIEKHAAGFVEPAKRADFDAYNAVLAESRAASRTIRVPPASVQVSEAAPEQVLPLATAAVPDPASNQPPSGSTPPANAGSE